MPCGSGKQNLVDPQITEELHLPPSSKPRMEGFLHCQMAEMHNILHPDKFFNPLMVDFLPSLLSIRAQPKNHLRNDPLLLLLNHLHHYFKVNPR
jgi:hypothetical protein